MIFRDHQVQGLQRQRLCRHRGLDQAAELVRQRTFRGIHSGEKVEKRRAFQRRVKIGHEVCQSL